jgi:hypothetical protein
MDTEFQNMTIYVGEGMYQRYQVGKRSPLVNEQRFGEVKEIRVVEGVINVEFEKTLKKFFAATYSTIKTK